MALATVAAIAVVALAVLVTTGRRSGAARKTPVTVTPYENGFLIGGGAGGQKATPDWVHNLRAHPHAQLIIKRVVREVVVDEPGGADRERAYAAMVAVYPEVNRFEKWGERPLPLFVARPR